MDSPAALGFSLPAEWDPHEATWLAWPHNWSDWPGKFASIPWVFGEIVRKITQGEKVRLLVRDAAQAEQASRALKRLGVDLSLVETFQIPTDRGWTRDCGPIFLRKGGRRTETAIVRFQFNAWSRYPNWKKDITVPECVAREIDCRLFRANYKGRDFVLEGGAIDINGRGTLLTTEECLLDQVTQVRNPRLPRSEVETALRSFLGVTNILWLGAGIAGDDTHGHVDDLCRFVGPRTVVLAQEDDPHDTNYRALEENRERLQGMRLEDGSKIEVAHLPMPAALYFDGQRLPASYANFYISNAFVLMPTFNDPNDRVALGVLAELFPGRRVVGIHAVDLVWGLGTIHCLTREQPLK
ncbi:MAG: agmatine deiminase family protein [Terriglobia bacterium]